MKADRTLQGWAMLLVALLIGVTPATAEADDDDEKGLVRLEVHLTSEEGGDPIKNASVYVKFKEERFLRPDKDRQWSVKTDKDGKAIFPVPLEEGQVLIQVVAEGWKTYGRFHKLKGPKHIIEIKLKRPKKWY